MGKNSLCKVVGIGIVCLHIFDGVIRELTQVRYVPKPKKEPNLYWHARSNVLYS